MSLAELISSPGFVAGLFFIVAFVYSSVGLGGGSSYTALMAILGFNALAIPLISLSLNLLVTSIGSFHFIRNRHASWRLILPFLITSMPMAYLGGSLQLPKTVFYWLLFISLLFVVARIYLWRETSLQLSLSARGKVLVSLVAGSILGLIAGIVGIGGGIYLVPLIIILGLGTGQQAAACGAIFVWLNSAAGLASRLQYNAIDPGGYLPLIIAVVLGGWLGSHLGSTRFSARKMEKILGLIILVAMGFLGRKLLFA
jgi:uncharacterized membrane protein YfcA